MMGIDSYRNYYLLDSLGELVIIDGKPISSNQDTRNVREYT